MRRSNGFCRDLMALDSEPFSAAHYALKNEAFLAEDLLSLILEQVHGLRTAHLRLSLAMPINHIFSFAKTPAGIVKSLDISTVGSSEDFEAPFPDIQIPRLHSFTATSGNISPIVPLQLPEPP